MWSDDGWPRRQEPGEWYVGWRGTSNHRRGRSLEAEGMVSLAYAHMTGLLSPAAKPALAEA